MQKPFANSSFQEIDQNSVLFRRNFAIFALIALIAVCTIGLALVNAHEGSSSALSLASSSSEFSSGMPLP